MIESQLISDQMYHHHFRGQFIDYFAQIEDHAAATLDRLIELKVIKKHPHLFGQKFETLRKTFNEKGVWQQPTHVEKTLSALIPFVNLRGTLGHSVMGDAKIGNETGLFWHPPGKTSWDQRKTMTQKEAVTFLNDLSDLVVKFKRQKLFNQASSPPQPSQAATADP